MALTSATLPYLKMIAREGADKVIKDSLAGDGRFAKGLNAYKGYITYKSVAEDLGMMERYKDIEELV